MKRETKNGRLRISIEFRVDHKGKMVGSIVSINHCDPSITLYKTPRDPSPLQDLFDSIVRGSRDAN